jgi:hypothetical protein
VEGEKLVAAVVCGETTEIATLLLPVMHWRDDVLSGIRFMLEGGEYEQRLLGVQLLMSKLRMEGDYTSAKSLARPLFRALEFDPAVLAGGSEHMRIVATNVLDTLTLLLDALPLAPELHAETVRWLRFLERTGLEPRMVLHVRLRHAEALALQGRYDDALLALEALRGCAFPADLAFDFQRLDERLACLLQRVRFSEHDHAPAAE